MFLLDYFHLVLVVFIRSDVWQSSDVSYAPTWICQSVEEAYALSASMNRDNGVYTLSHPGMPSWRRHPSVGGVSLPVRYSSHCQTLERMGEICHSVNTLYIYRCVYCCVYTQNKILMLQLDIGVLFSFSISQIFSKYLQKTFYYAQLWLCTLIPPLLTVNVFLVILLFF